MAANVMKPAKQVGARPGPGGPKLGSADWLKGLNGKQQTDFRRWIGAANQPKLDAGWAQGLKGADADRFDSWVGAANGWIRPGGPGPAEQLAWQSRRDAANQQLKDALARYEFESGQTEDQYVQAQQGMDRSFGRARERVPYERMGSGMLTSGMYRQDLQDLAGERLRALRGLLGERQSGLQGLELERQRQEAIRARALAQIEQEQALRRFALGSQVGQ